MSDIKTVTLNGGELKVEGLGGQNTVIVNRSSATLYASASANVTPDGDNTAAIPMGGVMNLYGTNGTVYLLGTGKVELEGTDYSDTGRAAVISSGGGSSGCGVSQEYVDSADAITLNSAKRYTDDEIVKANADVKAYTNAEAVKLSGELADLKGYIGYTDSDIYGLEADFENNRFTRLAGAVGKNPGADFDSMNAFGGRRRCAVADDGTVIAYYGDDTYEEDGLIGSEIAQVMVEQPKFYYKVVPLKTEKIDGADGYHLRKARYYISDTPKPGFKVHPAFIQNGVEADKIYLSAYEGNILQVTSLQNMYLEADEQIADFNSDKLSSMANVKPASGTTQALTRANARKLAQNRGAGWGITTIQTLSATQLLFAIEYAAFNSQAAIGNGNTQYSQAPDTGNNAMKSGATSSLGNASGTAVVNDVQAVSYRGEENLWGDLFKFVDGVIKSSPENFSAASAPGEIKINTDTLPSVYLSGGYTDSFVYSDTLDYTFFSGSNIGNSALPVGDRVWNTTETGTVITFGGLPHYKNYSGLFCYSLENSEETHNRMTGARLIYIPQPTETTQEVTAND